MKALTGPKLGHTVYAPLGGAAVRFPADVAHHPNQVALILHLEWATNKWLATA